MPYPYPFLLPEPADARAALMQKFHSTYRDGASRRSRYLQAERPKPYRARAQPKRPLLAQSREAHRMALGWGAFLKDETLRSPQGNVVRAAKGPCTPSRILPSYELEPYPFPLRRYPAHSDSDEEDCRMPFWADLSLHVSRVSCASSDSSEDDCAMPDCTSEYLDPPPTCFPPLSTVHEPESMSYDQSCVKAADEMFVMFIDENCMDD